MVADGDVEAFFRLVKAGFSQRRKQLHNSLAAGLGLSKQRTSNWLALAEIDPTRRPQTLSVEEWTRLRATPTPGA